MSGSFAYYLSRTTFRTMTPRCDKQKTRWNAVPFLSFCHSLVQVVFLNQIILHKKGDGSALAKSLIGLYFGLFKVGTLTFLDMDTERSLAQHFIESRGRGPARR
jgi:hypothetical protein